MADVGRPEFKPTRQQRKRVEQMVCCGMPKEDIARAIGISKPTLLKHFDEELANGFAKKRAEVIRMLFDAAENGNVSAQRKLEEMTRLVGAEAAFNSDAPAERHVKLGKKEEAAEAAKTAGEGSTWEGDLVPPGLRPN